MTDQLTQADYDDLNRWNQLAAQLKTIKAEELYLRKRIFAKFFPNPEKGVNKQELNDGFVLKGTPKTTTNVDTPALMALRAELPPGVEEKCMNWKASLNLKGYEELPFDQQAIIGSVITTKSSTPSLEMVKPKR